MNMADKEATVYIVDVGSTMREKCNGRKESSLDWAMNYVWENITSTVCKISVDIGTRSLTVLGSA